VIPNACMHCHILNLNSVNQTCARLFPVQMNRKDCA
jgi:hypothetical protein